MGREERDGGGFQVIEHTITPTLSELTAEVERLKAQRDDLLTEARMTRSFLSGGGSGREGMRVSHDQLHALISRVEASL